MNNLCVRSPWIQRAVSSKYESQYLKEVRRKFETNGSECPPSPSRIPIVAVSSRSNQWVVVKHIKPTTITNESLREMQKLQN